MSQQGLNHADIVPGLEQRFLKVSYHGLWSPRNRVPLKRVRLLPEKRQRKPETQSGRHCAAETTAVLRSAKGGNWRKQSNATTIKEQSTTQIDSKRHKSLLKHPHRVVLSAQRKTETRLLIHMARAVVQSRFVQLDFMRRLRSAPHKLLIRYGFKKVIVSKVS